MSTKVSNPRTKSRRPAHAAAALEQPVTVEPELESVKAETLIRRLHRLALDVHDGPMQNLTAIGFSLGDLRRRILDFTPPEQQVSVEAGLAQIQEELGKVESDLRGLVSALEQGAVKSMPVRDAIESEIGEFERRTGIRVAFIFDDDARAETDSQRIALQSVTRAALANVAKHSCATRVTIRLTGGGDRTTLEVEDNGKGFRADAPLKKGRMGLAGMKRRVELLGGDFHLASRPGGPTIVTATLRAWRPEDE